jgi:SNF2 family DNA or RNA helicase
MSRRTPFQHQLVGADYLIENEGGCLWVCPRGGKTLMMLKWLEWCFLNDMEIDYVLIVCPKPIIYVWENELKLLGVDVSTITSPFQSSYKPRVERELNDSSKTIFLVNYDVLEANDILRKYPWDIICFDEITRISNFEAARTDYCLNYIEQRDFPEGQMRAGLSGSPAAEGVFRAVVQMYLVFGYIYGFESLEDYVEEYWKYSDYQHCYIPKSRKHLKDLKEWSDASTFVITKAELKQIMDKEADKLYRVIKLPPTKWQLEMFQKIREDDSYYCHEDQVEKQFIPLTRVSFELQVCCGIDPFSEFNTVYEDRTPKYKYLAKLYREIGEPMCVWSFFTDAVRVVANEFNKLGIPAANLTASTDKVLENLRQKFQNGGIDVAAGQVQKVAEGLDFSRASTIVYISNHLGLQYREQSEMRADNLNKDEVIEIIDIIIEGSTEELVIERLKDKKEISDGWLERTK